MPLLTWDEIEPAAARAFSIWNGQPKLRWAREAWGIATDAGLADYDGSLDRHRAIMRFLALAGIYSDWCDAAWDVSSDPQYFYWAEDLEVSAFLLGQLIGADQDSESDESDDDILIGEALQQLADAARPDVLKALLRHFVTKSGLFLSLWRSTVSPDDNEIGAQGSDGDSWDEEEREGAPTDDKILNELTDEKLRAFGWIEEGCHPYR